MTWGEFKAGVEAQDVQEDDVVFSIEWPTKSSEDVFVRRDEGRLYIR